ncbi:putative glycerol kinase 5 [Atheta coriaria]|uniref:putative glycerol kinase 5 n=1 Tax=Dalotia coriaria TaxID=877792 RepID=UPI0031F3932A
MSGDADLSEQPVNDKRQFIAALDVGTTTLRCVIVDSNGDTVSTYSVPTKLIHPQVGYAEIPHEDLWKDTVFVIKSAIEKANLTPSEIKTLGITTQRATFITWDRESGIPYHNFITWKDIRCNELVKLWNRSFMFRSFKSVAYTLYLCTRNPRYLAGSSIKFTSSHTTMRLLYMLDNIPAMRKNIKNLMFGTVDTWLLYKLTAGRQYVTDYGNATSTGLVDPFEMDWSTIMHKILNIPRHIYPEIVANDYDLGYTEENVFGVRIKIGSLMADAQTSMIGTCCYSDDILKLTMGTGTFLNIITPKLHPGVTGIYPVVYYKLEDKLCYMAEAACNDTGTVITWALKSGLCENPAETANMASSVTNNDGVYFIPAFSGLGPPIYDEKAASGFFGIKPTTRREHMVRAILESIVFRIMLQYGTLRNDLDNEINTIYVDGGVSKNNFICQLLADMTGIVVERAISSEMSVLGAAYIAGLNTGIWKSREELSKMRRVDCIFRPTEDKNVRSAHFREFDTWQKVIERFKGWYP